MTPAHNSPPALRPLPPGTHRRFVPLAVLAFLPMFLLTGGYYFLRQAQISHHEEEQEYPPENQLPTKWDKWEKPLFAIIVSGQMHGYYDPCGCSDPQYGGLVRRYNLVEALKAKGWDVIGIDLGDIAQTKGIREQNLLKFDLSMKALARMNYRAVGIGMNEIDSPLGDALAQTWEKDRPFPRPLSLTLEGNLPGKVFHGLNARQYEIIEINNKLPKVGVVSMIGPDMRDALQNKAKLLSNKTEFPKALKDFGAANVEIGIMLHHEHPDVPANLQGGKRAAAVGAQRNLMALNSAKFADAERQADRKIPPIHLVLVLSDFDLPPATMSKLAPGLPAEVIELGDKGIHVGLIGVYREKRGGFRFQYDLIKMGPEWETPAAKKPGHPVIKLIEDYNNQLRAQKMLDRAPRTLHFNQLPGEGQNGLKATYVGSDRCADCHDHAFDVWKKTPHGHALETLENRKFPAGRHYDPECMKCHTTGFQHPGGYNDLVLNLANWPQGAKPTPQQLKFHNDGKPRAGVKEKPVGLRGVGCESCHGPGSEHVKAPKNKALYPIINPFAVNDNERLLVARLQANPKNKQVEDELRKVFDSKRAMGRACMNCHDLENDVNWGKPGKDLFDKWILYKHPLVHHLPERNPLKNQPVLQNGPAIKNVAPPPAVIEIIQKK